jgi:hypothetical protein
MSISDSILNQIKCCLNNEIFHIVNDPVVLKCGANACKACINASTDTMIRCFGCNGEHTKVDSLNMPKNILVESVIRFFLNDLLIDLNDSIDNITGLLKGFLV